MNSIYKQMNMIDDEESLCRIDTCCTEDMMNENFNPRITCTNILENDLPCDKEQEIGPDCRCSTCNADLVTPYVDSILDPNSKYKLIFNGDIVSKASSPDSGKNAPVVTVTKEFFDLLTANIHKNTQPGSNYGAFSIEELREPAKTILLRLRGIAVEEHSMQDETN